MLSVTPPAVLVLACCLLGCGSGQLSSQEGPQTGGTQPCRRSSSAQRLNARSKQPTSVDGFDERHCFTPTMGD